MELFKLFGKIFIQNSDANNAIDETTGRAESSEGKMSSAFKKIGTAVATYLGTKKILDFGTACVNVAASFEDAMLKVQSLSGATAEDYEKLSQAALDYGSKTAWTARDVADAMGYMALAGFDTNEILDSTSGMLSLASASGEQLATVTDILTDSMTGFGDSADQAGRYADVLAITQAKTNTTVGMLGEAFKYVAPLAGSYGYELEDVSTALGMMANAGVKGSMAGTAMSSIMSRLATDAGATSNSLGALGTLTKTCGVEFYNSDGSCRNLTDVMIELCDATKDMSVEQKAEIAKTIAGQEAQKGLLAILNQGSDAYKELNDQIRAVGESTESEAQAMAENMESGMGGAIRSMQSAWEGFKIKVGQKISIAAEPVVRNIASFLTETAIPMIGEFCERLGDVANVFGEVFGFVGDFVESIFGGSLGDIGTYFDEAISGVSEIFDSYMEYMRNVWESVGKPIFDSIASIFEGLFGGLTDAASQISFESVLEGIKTAFQTAFEFCKTVWESIGQPIFNTIDYCVGALAAVFAAKMPEIMEFVSDVFYDVIAIWENHLKPCVEAIGNFIENVLAPIFKSVFTGIIGPVVDTAFSFIVDWWNLYLKPLFTGIIDFITGVFSADWKKAFEGVVSIVEAIFGGLVAIIKAPINFLIDGLNAFIKMLNNIQIPDWVPGVGGMGINIPLIPKLEKGGILEKGQVGLLEGNGAEAVVPLDQNRRWISKVAKDMNEQGIGGSDESLAILKNISSMLQTIIDNLPDDIRDSIESGLRLNIDGREFGRMVKAVN